MPGDDHSEPSSDADEYVPTVDELAQSFLRTEPADEIRELEQELGSRSGYLQESIASSSDGDEEGSAGMGAPLALPAYFKNIINTALDRLSLVVNNIDVEIEDRFSNDGVDISKREQSSPISLNFHIESISVDSVTSEDMHGELDSATSPQAPDTNLGKRRMRMQNMCARLISDAENFVSMSRISRPSSPATTRSELSTSQRVPSELPTSQMSIHSVQATESNTEQPEEPVAVTEPIAPSAQASISSLRNESVEPVDMAEVEQPLMALSQHTVDEDRFADAVLEDEMNEDEPTHSLLHSRSSLPAQNLGGSSILFDEGILDYASHNDLLSSRFDDVPDIESPREETETWGSKDPSYSQQSQVSEPASEESTSGLPTVSMLGQSFRPPSTSASFAQSRISDRPQDSVDNLMAAQHHLVVDQAPPVNVPEFPEPSSQLNDDLSESHLFTHDDAESMYMSAMSAPQVDSTHQGHVPGGWDSSSTSSKSTASEKSVEIPEEMIAASILEPLPEADDGFETPRPGTPQSMQSSQPIGRATTPTPAGIPVRRLAKVFLTVDYITMWFPLGLEEQAGDEGGSELPENSSSIHFTPPNIGEDSVFAEMPGSFSNYANSSIHRRKPSIEASLRKRSTSKTVENTQSPKIPIDKKVTSPSLSIEVGSVAAHMDISTGRIMYGMINRVISAISSHSSTDEPSNKPNATPTTTANSLEVTVKHVGVAWVEHIMAESLVGNAFSHSLDLNPPSSFVRVGLETIHLSSQVRAKDSRAKLQVGKFVLASLDQDIISFQSPRPTSKRSINVLSETTNHDIEIDYEEGKDKRITIVTRPLNVMFDLQKLDEALSSFGGFSGVLELSSSISSANTINSPVISPPSARPRGVHFGDTPAPPKKNAVGPSTAPKIQVQLGEVMFTLKGKSCAMQVQTTSVRVAIREGNVRLKVSEIKLEGPFMDQGQTGAPLLVDIKGTTVNFLFAPEETDLARLISMITPSKDPFENNDDILIDTLLRQRRKGSVLRVEVSGVGVRIFDLQEMKAFEALGAELARLSKVAKYLPDDDRPGLLTLASVQNFEAGVAVNERLGDISIYLDNASVAHVGVPALLATEIGKATVKRGEEILVHELISLRPQDQLPCIMVRMVGDEMEPVVKAKAFNVCAEYHVTTIMAALGVSEDGTTDDIALGIAASVATITGGSSPKTLSREPSQLSSPSTPNTKPLHVDLLLRNCAIGLNPRKTLSKGLFVLTEAHLAGKQAKDNYSVTFDLRKASFHAIDDTTRLVDQAERPQRSAVTFGNQHTEELQNMGFVSLSSISAAKIYVNIDGDGKDGPQQVDVEFRNDLFVLESCADSTQTLIAILNGLQPPSTPSTAEKYRTTIPLQQMMESFTGDALIAPEEVEGDDFMSNADLVEDEVPTNLEFVGSIYNSQSLPTHEEMGDSLLGEDDLGALATPPLVRQRGDRGLLESFQEKYEITENEQDFEFNDDYFEESEANLKGKARKWDSTKNQYHLSNEFKVPEAPLKVRVRDMNIIWNLYDGYDWPRTRNIISQAVDDVEARAEERRRKVRDEDEDDDFIEEDFLFNSVWIGVPVKDEKGALARRINHDIDDLASETGSYATSTATRSTGATNHPRTSTRSKRRLKLERSKHKKIAFSLMDVAVDLIVFPPDSGETINSLNVRVRDFEIFDHVPTSTWKKFVTCLIEPSARQMHKPMINLEVVTVKPVTDLAASELVIKVMSSYYNCARFSLTLYQVTVLPLRLHVDQDALDFITRFFEFKEDTTPVAASGAEQPFIQRLEVQAVTLKLDYKPKRVDYRGLRSGHTTEFMNFLILDGSDIVLRHAIVYGMTSFDDVHKTLNDVWMPDVQRNQLPGVLSGLAAVRPLVNVGSGMRDLIVVPMREYRKDGRVVRSLQKGVYAFAKNTTSEVARLGAKVAIGTQNLLEGAETFLAPQTGSPRGSHHDWDGEDPTSSPPEETRAVSHYANQPIGVKAGLRSAARHLERDLLTARDAVIAIPAEVMEQGSGVGVAKALARHAPTVILRPALGATKALSNALLGVGNALDDDSRRKIEDVSSRGRYLLRFTNC